MNLKQLEEEREAALAQLRHIEALRKACSRRENIAFIEEGLARGAQTSAKVAGMTDHEVAVLAAEIEWLLRDQISAARSRSK